MLKIANIFHRTGALAAALVLASMSSASAETLFEKAKASRTVVVGIANEKPYGYLETDGTMKGVIIDVLRAALKPIGIDKVEANVSEFSAMIPGINARRFDIIGAGMAIRPQRCESVAFSSPISRLANVVAVKAGNPHSIHSLEDIAKSDTLKIGSQIGSSQLADLPKAGIPEDRVVSFALDTEAIAGLKAGRVDAIYFPSLQLSDLIHNFGDGAVERAEPFQVAKDDKGNPLYVFQAFGFNKEDSDFVNALNLEIRKLNESGELLKILEPYGFMKEDVPDPNLTAAQLCSDS
ncbi:ectoine/hydroxyectoine ABC transporter substrate-binding protein EhuB [Sinorhizobium meliloti]|uniref:ectoine/hydroxyectoine ABC transporter substrate-binding protein EhuB n=1 Tax=Rhizobium meliloti TaxID=382 RepID=UPI0001E4EB9A|nr:ectoine/hydroxyectoine ABC transporter substrate-binding protein EhuB [Sinorhizobium meliloti]AEG58049.1 ectoine/hydroxyectoine ABC transporter solute-binding protein [Sinorhizobium meliloti AK83]MDE4589019.1 ectoine/hydroxyectoine ABC transporter substrate-binding protein EhuB [Sinorhizobium meliloti]SEJ76337.1 polar amino acid transport system substrate-binding protein [Sinorhizobium meliloti]